MNITFNNYHQIRTPQSPSFKSNIRFCTTQDGRDMANITCTFRIDLDWADFAKLEIENFKHKDKVNIIQFASSDGSEAYTQIISLLEHGNEKALKKFFPIMAYDTDRPVIEMAKSKLINLNESDIDKIKSNCKDFHKYFSKNQTDINPSNYIYAPFNTCLTNDYTIYKANPILTNKVCFNRGDIFQIAPKIKDDSNTIILCRNVLSYFPENKILQVVQAFSQNLKTGSLIATGTLEKRSAIYYLLDYGFEQVMPNVFRKI